MTTAITFSRQNDAGTSVESPLTRTTKSTRFDRKVYSRIDKKLYSPGSFILLLTPENFKKVNFY